MSKNEKIQILKAVCEKKGLEYIACKELPHPDDWYILYCVVKSPMEYITYTFNINDKAFYHGHYNLKDLQTALEDMDQR